MPHREETLRQQISKSVAAPVAAIEQKIAAAFLQNGEYGGDLNSEELGVILKKVLYTLVDRQKVAGFNVPLLHHVSQMNVTIAQQQAHVRCEVHVHAPVTAFIKFRYVLENIPETPRLRLKNNALEVKEVTKPFDVAAKLALRVMDVERIARRELSDPGGVIVRTLPEQLVPLGYEGGISQIELAFTEQNMLRVFMKAENGA